MIHDERVLRSRTKQTVPRMNGYLTFIHRFSRKVQCTARIKDEPPQSGAYLSWAFEWSQRPKPKHIPHYRQWMLRTNQILADRWQTSILYALGIAHDKTEVWTFKPGQPPKLVRKLYIGIP